MTQMQHSNGSAVTRYEPTPAVAPVTQQNETGAAVLGARAKAEIEARTIVALNRPRNVDTFRIRLLAACQRPRFAEGARYSKPIGGGSVQGLSIRFAEECARHYGNLDITTSVVSEDDERRVLRVSVTDLEVNLPWSAEVVVSKTVERRKPKDGDEVLRQRTNKQGQPVFIIRATDDDLLVKQNALVSKAVRNLILNVVPSDIVEEAEEQILATIQNEDATDPAAARKRIADAFYGLGVMPDQLAEFLGHGLESVTPAELTFLRSIYTGMKSEGVTWAEVMAQRTGAAKPAEAAKESAPPPTKAKGAGARLRDAAAAPAPKPAPPADPELEAEIRRQAALERPADGDGDPGPAAD